MYNKALKQPTKYTHCSINKDNGQEQGQKSLYPKTKHIQKKLPNKKTINKKNQPSALRLEAINETFHKIQTNTQEMLNNFKLESDLLEKFLQYTSKVKCKCQNSRNIKYYCIKCMSKNQQLQFPKVTLPLNITIIHHTSQNIKKSSIVPMMLLSDQISLRPFSSQSKPEQLLNGLNAEQTFILFPHKNSKKIKQMQMSNISKIKNVVVLDCTWFQTDQLISCLEKQNFNNFIRLQDYQSLYWRYNHHSEKALCSAQALSYFLKQYQACQGFNVNQYDSIMFLLYREATEKKESKKHKNKQLKKRSKLKVTNNSNKNDIDIESYITDLFIEI